jgi:hypothetical protein
MREALESVLSTKEQAKNVFFYVLSTSFIILPFAFRPKIHLQLIFLRCDSSWGLFCSFHTYTQLFQPFVRKMILSQVNYLDSFVKNINCQIHPNIVKSIDVCVHPKPVCQHHRSWLLQFIMGLEISCASCPNCSYFPKLLWHSWSFAFI